MGSEEGRDLGVVFVGTNGEPHILTSSQGSEAAGMGELVGSFWIQSEKEAWRPFPFVSLLWGSSLPVLWQLSLPDPQLHVWLS